MKTIEEKAKAYDEALGRARNLMNQIQNNELIGFPDQFTEIFPELAESEDEKVRKEMLEFVSSADISEILDEETQARWYNYLQRQKEQKPHRFCDDTLKAIDKARELDEQEQKPAEWSEEDEENIESICSRLDSLLYTEDVVEKTNIVGEIAWLKSLRPSWKPSEEQMSMLLAVINDPNNAGAESCQIALREIYRQLKKL